MNGMRRTAVALTLALAVFSVPAAGLGQGFTGALRDTQGQAVGADQLRGRVTVFLFGGIVDPQSPEELPALQKVAERYDGRGVDVIWVSLDPVNAATDPALRQFATRYGFTGRIFRDPGGQVLNGFNTGRRSQLPTVVVLDKNASPAGKPIGGFDRDASFIDRIAAIVDPLL